MHENQTPDEPRTKASFIDQFIKRFDPSAGHAGIDAGIGISPAPIEKAVAVIGEVKY